MKSWVDFRILLGIIEAIRINKIISPPTNTKNKLNPTHTDIRHLVMLKEIAVVIIIRSKIIILTLFQFIRLMPVKIIIVIKLNVIAK